MHKNTCKQPSLFPWFHDILETPFHVKSDTQVCTTNEYFHLISERRTKKVKADLTNQCGIGPEVKDSNVRLYNLECPHPNPLPKKNILSPKKGLVLLDLQ